nr:hypothetical protein CFP56_46794 [Quercus suber]
MAAMTRLFDDAKSYEIDPARYDEPHSSDVDRTSISKSKRCHSHPLVLCHRLGLLHNCLQNHYDRIRIARQIKKSKLKHGAIILLDGKVWAHCDERISLEVGFRKRTWATDLVPLKLSTVVWIWQAVVPLVLVLTSETEDRLVDI